MRFSKLLISKLFAASSSYDFFFHFAVVEIGFGNATYTVVEGHGHVYACVEITNMEGEELERDIPFLLVSSDGSATGIKNHY